MSSIIPEPVLPDSDQDRAAIDPSHIAARWLGCMIDQFEGHEAECRDALQDFILIHSPRLSWQSLCKLSTCDLIGMLRLIVESRPARDH